MALIAMGCAGVSETRLIDALWPFLEGDSGHNVFTTTLHRLRKILGAETAVVVSKGKVDLNPGVCWVDVRQVEMMLDKADKAWERKRPPEKAAELAEQALSAYKGNFLANEEAFWALPMRDRLKSKFARCVVRLGRFYEDQKKHEKAVFCYSRGLESDPLIEEFYRRLMACHICIGQMSEARAVFERCQDNLSKVLGTVPSPETLTLLSKIQQ